MSPPTAPALLRLRDLDESSLDFHQRLEVLALRNDYYKACVPKLSVCDTEWFVEYLDEVRLLVALPHPPLKPA